MRLSSFAFPWHLHLEKSHSEYHREINTKIALEADYSGRERMLGGRTTTYLGSSSAQFYWFSFFNYKGLDEQNLGAMSVAFGVHSYVDAHVYIYLFNFHCQVEYIRVATAIMPINHTSLLQVVLGK